MRTAQNPPATCDNAAASIRKATRERAECKYDFGRGKRRQVELLADVGNANNSDAVSRR